MGLDSVCVHGNFVNPFSSTLLVILKTPLSCVLIYREKDVILHSGD